MRYLPALIVLFFVITVGCVPEGDTIYNSYNYYYPEDSTGNPDTTGVYKVQVAYPAQNEVVEIWYDWFERVPPNGNGCLWGYRVDTTVYAQVTHNVPGTISEARVFLRTNPNGSFNQYSVLSYPGGSSFAIRVYQFNQNFSGIVPPDQIFAFWVSLTTVDSTNYISQTVSFSLESQVNYDMASVPVTPLADSLYESIYQQRMTIEWCPRSPNADSFYVSMREDGSGDLTRLAFPSQSDEANVNFYLPLTDYSVWISAANGFGESAPSDTMHLFTDEPILPEDLRATTYADGQVRLQWNNRCYPDSMLISRRDTLGDWFTIQSQYCSAGFCPTYFDDTTGVSRAVYYYRLGAKFRNGLWWTSDSVGVWIPWTAI